MAARSKAPARSSGIFDLLGVGSEAAPDEGGAKQQASIEATATASGILRIPLDHLRIDLAQPRRPLPISYATQVNSGALTLVQAIKKWAKDTGVPLSVEFDSESDLAKGAGRTLDALRRELALPILDVGLINPISVIKVSDSQFTIETGERRALAHAFLTAAGHDGFDAVPAQVVDRGEVVRRQFEENEARQDLTAVQKARMWWSARYRLSGRGRIDWSKFANTDNLNEVLGSEDKGDLVPWTKAEQQLKRSRQMRIYSLRIFDLPAEAVRLAEEYALPEKVLRPIMDQHAGDGPQQLALIQAEAQRHDSGVVSSAKDMARRVAKAAEGKGNKKPASGADDAGAYKRALASLDKLMGGQAMNAKDMKRLTDSLVADEAIVDTARRLKPLIDRLAGK